MDALQALQPESEHTGATILCGWKASAFACSACLLTGERANERASEVMQQLLSSGGCSDGEEIKGYALVPVQAIRYLGVH